jgi:cytochrome c553
MLSLMREAEANAAALATSPADRGRIAAGQRLCSRCHADHRDRPGR